MDEFEAFMRVANLGAIAEVLREGADADASVRLDAPATGLAAAAASAYECAWRYYIDDPTDITNNTVNIAIALLRSLDNESADAAQGRLNCAYAIYSASVFLPLPSA